MESCGFHRSLLNFDSNDSIGEYFATETFAHVTGFSIALSIKNLFMAKVIKRHFFSMKFDAASKQNRRFFQYLPGFIGPKTFFMLKCYV